jgi:mannose-6-phosphate isomerase-like protein (cupin superfamily)
VRVSFFVLLTSLWSACAGDTSAHGRGSLIRPEEPGGQPQWSERERNQPVALRNVRRSDQASFHLLRLRAEQPAYAHDRSDLVFMVLAGNMEMTVSGEAIELSPGDVVEVPRGTPYALRNQGEAPGSAYLIFTPALAADDRRLVRGPIRRESAWKWNLWLQ